MGNTTGTRVLGGILMLLGGLLFAGMSLLLRILWNSLMYPGYTVGDARFTGSPMMGKLVLAILAAVGLFGAAAFGLGLYRLATGRNSPWIAGFVFGLFGLILALAWVLDWSR